MTHQSLKFLFPLILFSFLFNEEGWGQCVSGNCKDGRGIYVFKSQERYEGEWKNSLMNGTGKYYFANGGIYEGQWRNGKTHGQGRRTSKDGSYYEGEFQDGEETGKGTYVSARGTVKKGTFTKGKLNGYGTMSFRNGDRYEGNFVNDQTEGTGIYYYANGDRFEGEFKENLQTGEGTLYYAKGGTLKGFWKEGKYQSGSEDGPAPAEMPGISLIKNPKGIFETTVVVNGTQKMEMVLNTGTPEVSLAPDMVLKLVQSKAIGAQDIVAGGSYTDAKGNVNKTVKFKIKELNIGGVVIKDVSAGVSTAADGTNQLGLSALEKLGKLEIDFRKKVVTKGN